MQKQQTKTSKAKSILSEIKAVFRSRGKHVKPKSFLKRALAATLATIAVAANLTFVSTAAHALSVDASAASFNFNANSSGGNATLISGTTNKVTGSVVKFSNVTGTSIPGVSIDAVVTATLVSSTISVYDSPGTASNNADYFQVDTGITGTNSYSQFRFDFYEGGTYTGANTGIPIVLRNVSVTSLDLDGASNCQFTDFTAFQRYMLSNPTYVQVKTNANDTNVPVGATRFLASRCTNNDANIVEDAVQVQYDSVTSFTVKFGSNVSAPTNYFAIAFKPLSALYPTATIASSSNTANQPPTSSNTTVNATSGAPQVLQLADFGNYSDADGNPFSKVQITALPSSGTLEKLVNGVWVPVVLNDEITVADISNGNLRFTGSSATSLQFKVYDGGLYSSSAYTMTLSMSTQAQTITFNNPGTKTPTTPAFASGATASSGLTVTLTSLTPGICTVSGLNIVPVAAGSCTIVATQAGNSSYSEAQAVTQTFPITTLTAQTITAPNPGNQTWSGSSFTITRAPTASSGLTVTMISTTPSVCTVSGFVITIVGPGNCTIRNTQAGNATYGPAPQVEYTFAVTPPASNYTVTYNGNNNFSGTVPAVTTGNGSVTLRGNTGTLARSGYTLTGWNTNAGGTGTHYDLSSAYNLTADVTLYAEWTANASYSVTYLGNNNTGGTVPSNTTGNGSVNLAANTGTLVRTGYTLTGWNTNAGGTGTHYDLSASYNLTANVTLYAEWTALSYTVTYDGNNNFSGTVPSTTTGYGSVTLRGNTGNLARSGYSLTGWNTNAGGTGTHYDLSASYNLTADVTLYAEWTADAVYTVTYNGNNNTGGTVPTHTTGNGSVTLAGNTGTLVRTGYELTGWNTAANGSGTHHDLSSAYNLTANVTLYAEWTALSYTVTYDGNSNTGGAVPAHTTGYGSVSLRGNTGNLVRTGYTINGWNTQVDGQGTHYALSGGYDLIANVTLYAEWNHINYTITYNGNSKTSGTAPASTTGHGTTPLAQNTGTLARTGYTFAGWNTAANGSGTHYDLGDNYNLIADVTLYAQWTALSFTLTFDGNTASNGTAPISIAGYGHKTVPGNLGNLVKANYTFKGWNTAANGSGTRYTAASIFDLIADTTLYAEWVLTPQVVYNANGSTGGTTPGEVPAGSPVTVDPNTGQLHRSGFRFNGWNTSPNGNGTHYVAGATPTLPVGTVLYAEWVPVSSLASTGSRVDLVLETAVSLVGLGMFLMSVSSIRRRRA